VANNNGCSPVRLLYFVFVYISQELAISKQTRKLIKKLMGAIFKLYFNYFHKILLIYNDFQ